MWRTPNSIAIRSSATDLLLPCSAQADAGTPAATSATCSSPPDATSSSNPSSYASFAMALHRNALVA